MAAPPDAELSPKNQPKHVDAHTVREDSGFFTEDVRNLREHVVDFLLNKAGDELKSEKSIGLVLESFQEENEVLSEQVRR